MIKYYYAGGQRVAMRVGSNAPSFLLGDHLGSTSITANSSGSKVAELRYHPWGGTRFTSGTTPTTRRYTGQIEDAAIGLYFYNARYYDSALGRFIQADTIVPSPANPQSLNRYAYVLNNPLRYTDPTGHFSEEQLIQWFGKNWRDLFNESWITLLLAAEFGDALLYEWNGNTPLVAIFALSGNDLVGWDLGSGFNDRKTIAMMDLQQKSNTGVLALFRNSAFNIRGGPSKPFEDVSNLHDASLEYVHVTGNLGLSSLTLPDTWYVGPQESVYIGRQFVGLDFGLSDVLDLGQKGIATATAFYAARKLGEAAGKKVLEAAGGWVGLAILAVDVAEWTRWDTVYYVSRGTNLPPQPVPMPSPQ